jgi:CheY-like chemotaxis protein
MLSRFIYVIETDAIDRYITSASLIDTFPLCRIFPFNTVDSAIYSLKHTNEYPSLILVDQQMPDKDGWDFLEEYVLLDTYSLDKCKVIMLSSTSNPFDAVKAKKYDCLVDFIKKPVTDSYVIDHVKAHLN